MNTIYLLVTKALRLSCLTSRDLSYIRGPAPRSRRDFELVAAEKLKLKFEWTLFTAPICGSRAVSHVVPHKGPRRHEHPGGIWPLVWLCHCDVLPLSESCDVINHTSADADIHVPPAERRAGTMSGCSHGWGLMSQLQNTRPLAASVPAISKVLRVIRRTPSVRVEESSPVFCVNTGSRNQ